MTCALCLGLKDHTTSQFQADSGLTKGRLLTSGYISYLTGKLIREHVSSQVSRTSQEKDTAHTNLWCDFEVPTKKSLKDVDKSVHLFVSKF